MSSNNEKTDKKMDYFIKKGINATYKDLGATLMFYPPTKEIQNNSKKTFLQKLLNYIGLK